MLTSAVARSGVPVRIETADGKSADAASIIMVMSLGVSHGDVVNLTADGEGSDALLIELAKILESSD
jgi:phosphocarrier protein